MEEWKQNMEQGKLFLSQQAHAEAIYFFHKALKNCPPEQDRDIQNLFFYIGVALKKIGFGDEAARIWGSGYFLYDDIYCAAMINLLDDFDCPNPAIGNSEDWQMFCNIHITRYLKSTKANHNTSDDEKIKHAIYDILSVYWEELIMSDILLGKDSSEKMEIFKSVQIEFPK